MLASTARNLLGFPEKENGQYNVWHTEIAGFMAQNNIENQTQAGAEEWAEVQDFAISHRYARGYKAGYTMGKNPATLQEALTTILANIQAKESKKRKIAAAEDAARGMHQEEYLFVTGVSGVSGASVTFSVSLVPQVIPVYLW